MGVHTKRGRRPKKGSAKSSSSSATRADHRRSIGARHPVADTRAKELDSETRQNVAGLTRARELQSKLNDRKLDLIKADLDTAYTFASMARETNDQNKKIRNRKNARKGYNSILHFLSTAKLAHRETDAIYEGIAQLRCALIELGETSGL